MLEGGGASVFSNENSRETTSSEDSPQGSGKQSENDLSNEEESSHCDSVQSSASSLSLLKKEGVTSDNEAEVKSQSEGKTTLTSNTDYNDLWGKKGDVTSDGSLQRPMISVRRSEDLFGMVNGSLDYTVVSQGYHSSLPLEQPATEVPGCGAFQATSIVAEQQVADQPSGEYPTLATSFGPNPLFNPQATVQQEPYEDQKQAIGSCVVMSPVRSSQPVPRLPSCIQLSKRPIVPLADSAPEAKRKKEEEMQFKLTDSITLVTQTPKPQTKNVADLLANRGVTVVQTATSHALPKQLNSAVSITRSPILQKVKAEPKASTNRLPIVDLTKESDTPRRFLNSASRLRRPAAARSVCQICDKRFQSPAELTQHMSCHRGSRRFECRECTAQYTTEAALQAHRQRYHGAGGPSPDMAIPVVDLKQRGVQAKLSQLGIRSVIPLAQLHSGRGGGIFGLPVVAVDSASNPAICNIGALGASNLLPLGPLKNVSFNNNTR